MSETTTAKNMRLFTLAVDRAKRNIGKEVFSFQPQVIRKALVAAEILTILNEQDEDVPSARVRDLALILGSILDHSDV